MGPAMRFRPRIRVMAWTVSRKTCCGPPNMTWGSWSRVGHDMSLYQWAYVGREKGKPHVDERTDEAVTEAVKNGVQIVMTLDKGNWL